WHAAALGMTARAAELLDGPAPPTAAELNDAFWQACHGGQRRTAAYLLARGADRNWIPATLNRRRSSSPARSTRAASLWSPGGASRAPWAPPSRRERIGRGALVVAGRT